jgi:hypothetical protein
MPDIDELLRSHDLLRGALIVAGRRIGKLQFGKRRDDPVLVLLRAALREARAVRKQWPRMNADKRG